MSQPPVPGGAGGFVFTQLGVKQKGDACFDAESQKVKTLFLFKEEKKEFLCVSVSYFYFRCSFLHSLPQPKVTGRTQCVCHCQRIPPPDSVCPGLSGKRGKGSGKKLAGLCLP